MNNKKVFKRISLFVIGSVLCTSPLRAEENTDEAAREEIVYSAEAEKGAGYFQGGERFENGGPSCVTCHNVTNDEVMPGGLFAKDLTDAYERLGIGMRGFMETPPFPAMAASYSNNPITPEEADNLLAFFEYASAVKDSQKDRKGYMLFIIGGGIGLVVLLGFIQLLWGNRKRKMVKQDIFMRQRSAVDAKF